MILPRTAGSAAWLFITISEIFMIWQSGPVWRNPEKLFRVKKTYDTWQEGLVQIFEAVYENKTLVQNACHAIGREKIENYLFKLTHDLIMVWYRNSPRSFPLQKNKKILLPIFINTALWESCWTGSAGEWKTIIRQWPTISVPLFTAVLQILFIIIQIRGNDKSFYHFSFL